ncbi:MAG: endonuclease/exonuclease/phosphatase family protein [Patescibacteria group bacterium]
MQLKILSWNIWYDGHFDEISRFLASFDADILGLQEVVPDDPTRDTIGFLKGLGYQHVIAPVLTIKKDGRTMSNAIFSKYPIVSSEIYTLSDTDSRNALRADIKVGETILHVFSTHLLHTHQQSSDTQELQAKNLVEALAPDHLMVMGDFNATPSSAVIQKMRKVLVDTHSASVPTLNANLFDCRICDPQAIPTTRLDYIFTSKDIKTHSFKVHDAAGSDHLALSVIAEI